MCIILFAQIPRETSINLRSFSKTFPNQFVLVICVWFNLSRLFFFMLTALISSAVGRKKNTYMVEMQQKAEQQTREVGKENHADLAIDPALSRCIESREEVNSLPKSHMLSAIESFFSYILFLLLFFFFFFYFFFYYFFLFVFLSLFLFPMQTKRRNKRKKKTFVLCNSVCERHLQFESII